MKTFLNSMADKEHSNIKVICFQVLFACRLLKKKQFNPIELELLL